MRIMGFTHDGDGVYRRTMAGKVYTVVRVKPGKWLAYPDGVDDKPLRRPGPDWLSVYSPTMREAASLCYGDAARRVAAARSPKTFRRARRWARNLGR